MADPDRILAPWRIDYILGPKKLTCPFCDAPREPPSETNLVLARAERVFVVLTRFPYTGCHVLVVPYAHVAGLAALERATYGEMMDLGREVAQRLERACRPHGLNVGMNLGTAAGAGIAEHLHLHVVPRWSGDNNFMAVVAGTRVLSQDPAHAWALLRPHFLDLDVLT